MNEKLLVTNRDKSLRTLQLIQLEGLKELDRICRMYNIKYSLGGGTCLGQIRHGGFIPWDDDIDIDMTTENYEKFIEVAPKELDKNKFFLRCQKTDKKHLRSCARLEIKYTNLGIKNWDKAKMKVGIFIDIFQWNYLPNNKILRKITSSLLFYIRCMQNYKMFKVCAKKINPKHRTIFVFFCKLISTTFLIKTEKILLKFCNKKRTNWIMDNAIIHGNHGGYRSDGIDEYEDVQFEGLTVMNKKNVHNFMKTIYGENYINWLSPVQRISHHNWTKINFGVYEEIFDAPNNYKDYLTVKYNLDKLKHMKNISLKIAEDIQEICKKKHLKCFLLGNDAYIKAKDVDEYGSYWNEPLKLVMSRKDYTEFSKVAQKYLGNKYFYQTIETDSEYKYSYARIRLNNTYIRENNIPKYLEEKFNNAFFIKIIPLDNTSNDSKTRKRHMKKIRYLNHFISLKWKKGDLKSFIKANWKIKVKLIALLPFSVEKLHKILLNEAERYNNIDTDYFIDSTGYQLSNKIIPKNIFGKGKIMDYNGYKIVFPSNIEEYMNLIDKNKKSKSIKKIEKISYIKHEFPNSFERYNEKMIKSNIKTIQKKYFACYLNYFDLPDYQLTVLRYDEKNDTILSNEELLGYK